MDVIKNGVRPAKDVVHIPFDVAVFHVYPADTVGYRLIAPIAGIYVERVLTPEQADVLQLHAIAVRPQRHALMRPTVDGIQQAIGYAEIQQLKIRTLRPDHRRAVGAYRLAGSPGAQRILIPCRIAFAVLLLAIYPLAIARYRELRVYCQLNSHLFRTISGAVEGYRRRAFRDIDRLPIDARFDADIDARLLRPMLIYCALTAC